MSCWRAKSTNSPCFFLNIRPHTRRFPFQVWMDKHADIYYAVSKNRQYGSGDQDILEQRKAWRREHKCKSFQWYLENKFPDLDIPSDLQVGQEADAAAAAEAAAPEVVGANSGAVGEEGTAARAEEDARGEEAPERKEL